MNHHGWWVMLLPAQRQIPLKRDGVLRSAVLGQGRGGRRMDGKSSYCGLGNIDLVINNAMNLKWNSSVSAKAGYFCHKRHITQLENIDIKRDGKVRGRKRRRFLGTCALQREGRGFTSRWGVQGKFSASPNWKLSVKHLTNSASPFIFQHVIVASPTRLHTDLSLLCAQDLRVSCILPTLFCLQRFSFLSPFSLTLGSYFQILWNEDF